MARKTNSLKRNNFFYNFNLKKLCTPSFIYFIISLFGLALLGLQNLNNNDTTLCVGNYNCSVGNKLLVFVLNGIYILFWTFVNLLTLIIIELSELSKIFLRFFIASEIKKHLIAFIKLGGILGS